MAGGRLTPVFFDLRKARPINTAGSSTAWIVPVGVNNFTVMARISAVPHKSLDRSLTELRRLLRLQSQQIPEPRARGNVMSNGHPD